SWLLEWTALTKWTVASFTVNDAPTFPPIVFAPRNVGASFTVKDATVHFERRAHVPAHRLRAEDPVELGDGEALGPLLRDEGPRLADVVVVAVADQHRIDHLRQLEVLRRLRVLEPGIDQ